MTLKSSLHSRSLLFLMVHSVGRFDPVKRDDILGVDQTEELSKTCANESVSQEYREAADLSINVQGNTNWAETLKL